MAVPDPIEIDPVLPLLDVPELNTRAPLTPFAPAFTVLIVIVPDVVPELAPEVRLAAPPVAETVPLISNVSLT